MGTNWATDAVEHTVSLSSPPSWAAIACSLIVCAMMELLDLAVPFVRGMTCGVILSGVNGCAPPDICNRLNVSPSSVGSKGNMGRSHGAFNAAAALITRRNVLATDMAGYL